MVEGGKPCCRRRRDPTKEGGAAERYVRNATGRARSLRLKSIGLRGKSIGLRGKSIGVLVGSLCTTRVEAFDCER